MSAGWGWRASSQSGRTRPIAAAHRQACLATTIQKARYRQRVGTGCLHLDCTRTYTSKLEAEGVIQRQGDGFPLDPSRVAYLRYLRRERQQSPRTQADAGHVKVKTELLQLKLAEKRHELVSRDAYEAMIDQMAGLVLTKLGGWPARVAGTDLVVRRRAEAVLRELRTEIAEAASKLADEANEPPFG